MAVTKDSKVATIIALPTGIRVAKTAMQRNVPNYLFQVEYAGKYHGFFYLFCLIWRNKTFTLLQNISRTTRGEKSTQFLTETT